MGTLAQASTRRYPGVKPSDDDHDRHLREIAGVLNNVLKGKLNCTGTFTVTANAATTTLSDPRIGANSVIHVMPQTAHAAAEIGTLYFTAFGDGSCTVNHANSAQTDRTFSYAVIG